MNFVFDVISAIPQIPYIIYIVAGLTLLSVELLTNRIMKGG